MTVIVLIIVIGCFGRHCLVDLVSGSMRTFPVQQTCKTLAVIV